MVEFKSSFKKKKTFEENMDNFEWFLNFKKCDTLELIS